MAFRVIYRDADECRHDTGVFHSPELDCARVEREMDELHMREDDPLHEELWHDGETTSLVSDMDGVRVTDSGINFIDPDAE